MTHALVPARESAVLKEHPRLAGTVGGTRYEISYGSEAVDYSAGSVRAPLEWAFGQGGTGQTYLYRQDGQWFESRVSFFPAAGVLDLTMGAQNITPHNAAETAGRPVPASEVGLCFGCHASGTPDSKGFVPGIQCERCHRSTAAHVAAKPARMAKLSALSTEEMSDFCGQCHRTWAKVAADGPRGIQNVRFQPYRLGNSKCYDAADPRIRCTACHDPHGPLETAASAYDARCIACHSLKTCKVAKKDCVTCHMPQLELPGAHRKFTDHMIRIVRAGEAYPE
jgi:hypothetical protein